MVNTLEQNKKILGNIEAGNKHLTISLAEFAKLYIEKNDRIPTPAELEQGVYSLAVTQKFYKDGTFAGLEQQTTPVSKMTEVAKQGAQNSFDRILEQDLSLDSLTKYIPGKPRDPNGRGGGHEV
jgi:hypothetical protein